MKKNPLAYAFALPGPVILPLDAAHHLEAGTLTMDDNDPTSGRYYRQHGATGRTFSCDVILTGDYDDAEFPATQYILDEREILVSKVTS